MGRGLAAAAAAAARLCGQVWVGRGQHVGDDQGGFGQAPGALLEEGGHVGGRGDERAGELQAHALGLVDAQGCDVQRALHAALRAPEVPPVRLHHHPQPCAAAPRLRRLQLMAPHICDTELGALRVSSGGTSSRMWRSLLASPGQGQSMGQASLRATLSRLAAWPQHRVGSSRG